MTPPAAVAASEDRLTFSLPAELEASEPAEARGLTRDAVRMLVAHHGDSSITHSTFALLPSFLDPGDLVVINTSGTIPAAVDATALDGEQLVLHLSTALDDGRWIVEPRRIVDTGRKTTERWNGAVPRRLMLPSDGRATLVEPFDGANERLWVATLDLDRPVLTWLSVHGRPIRYAYVDRPWPIGMYQNVYVTEPGSAEMPSAGRPFTADLVTRLVAKGVGITPIVLHTGVASLEAGELPYPERMRVPAFTAERINAARAGGHRVIAVGTTVVRAIETAAGPDGAVAAFDGWTDLVVTPARGVRAIDGLLTGWHEPEASHLLMLEAIASTDLLRRSYEASLAEGYRWHEFGDVHLILR
jgi:S-adenosylmethionine:tRNA ribosyltransferase-isomerase